ncbi:MAG: TonB-dependent receptor [Opitutales bacterium]
MNQAIKAFLAEVKTVRLFAIALTFTFSTSHAHAQEDVATLEAFEAEGKYLYSSQVNALKTPTPIIDVPQSLSIVTAEQISLRGFSSIAEIIDYTPGVSNSQGEGHRDAVVFRGVRSTADFFIDGFRDDVQYYRPLYNMEQIEILRGPNALFFGRGGTGGVLNRVTKKGVVGENFNGYEASVDTFGAYSVQMDNNFAIGEDAAFRLNSFYEGLENHRDFYNGDRFGVNPTFRVQPTDQTTVDLSYEYIDHERFIDRGIPTGTDGEPVEAFEDIVFGDPELNNNLLEAHILKGKVQHRFTDNLKGRLGVTYGDYDKLYENFYAAGYDQAASPDVVTLDGYIDTTQRENLMVAGDLIGEVETGSLVHTLVAGFEYIDSANNNDRYNPDFDPSDATEDQESFLVERPINISNGVGVNASGLPTAGPFTDLNDRNEADITVYSFYLSDEIAINDHLDVVLGARYDSFEIDVLDVKARDEGALPEHYDYDRTDDRISPRLGLVYKPVENASIYTSYSESFLPSSGEQFASISSSNRNLDPSEYSNLEAGVKYDFAQGLSATFSVFQIEESSPSVDPNDPELQVFSDTKTTGFEIQILGDITEQWSISAGYSYLDGEQAGSDLRPRELPEHMFSIWNTYQLTEKLGLGLGLTYQGESFINNSNTATLPSYTRFDAAVYYQVSENLRLQLNVENLTDELYFPNAHSTHQATVGAPINARLAIIGRF